MTSILTEASGREINDLDVGNIVVGFSHNYRFTVVVGVTSVKGRDPMYGLTKILLRQDPPLLPSLETGSLAFCSDMGKIVVADSNEEGVVYYDPAS